MPVKMIVFDMAGTTVMDKDFVATAFQTAFRNQDFMIEHDEINPLMGYEKKLAIQTILERHGVNATGELIETVYEDFISEMIAFYESSPEVKPAGGAEQTFQFFQEKSVTVALNTGFPRRIADIILDRFQWIEKGLVDDYIASDEVRKGRPYPFMIEELRFRAGIADPMFVAKVGDTAVDILEGKNAGCRYNIGITTGASGSAELKISQPTHIVDSLLEIPKLIA